MEAEMERIVDMRYSEFTEDANQVQNVLTVGNRIRFFSKNDDARVDSEATS
jgi:hypothetical protein